MKLTDTMLVLLSKATKRGDRAIILPEKLKGAPGRTLVKKLIAARLVVETTATDSLPVWRRDATKGNLALIVTANGLKTVGIEEASSPSLSEAGSRSSKAPRQAKPGRKAPEKTQERRGRRGSKKDEVLALLRRTRGASIDDLTGATGWLPHTARAVMSGLRKSGHTIDREKLDGVTVYRLGGPPKESKKARAARAA